MFGTHGDGAKNKLRSVDTSDIVEILAIYFPENDFSMDDDRLMLTVDLIHFFSSPPGMDIAFQVHLSHDFCFIADFD